MEPLFENTCRWTKEALREMNYRVQKKWLLLVGAVAVLFLAVLLFCSVIYSIPLGNLMSIYAILFLVLVVAYMFLPWIQAVSGYKRYVGLYGSALENSTRFYEDRFTVVTRQSGGEVTLEYAKIRQLMETKSLLLLKMEGKWVVLLDKNGFTRGDPASLQAFLREKMAAGKA